MNTLSLPCTVSRKFSDLSSVHGAISLCMVSCKFVSASFFFKPTISAISSKAPADSPSPPAWGDVCTLKLCFTDAVITDVQTQAVLKIAVLSSSLRGVCVCVFLNHARFPNQRSWFVLPWFVLPWFVLPWLHTGGRGCVLLARAHALRWVSGCALHAEGVCLLELGIIIFHVATLD